jgi:hypothetical protein
VLPRFAGGDDPGALPGGDRDVLVARLLRPRPFLPPCIKMASPLPL